MKFAKSLLMGGALVATVFATSCQQEEQMTPETKEVPTEILAALDGAGFSTDNVIGLPDGDFLVEGDILMTANEIMNFQAGVAGEHTHTTALVTGLPRVIKVRNGLGSGFDAGVQFAVDRYNAEGLQLTFQKVSSGADINIVASPWYYRFFGILGSAGFPANGNPFGQIQMTTSYYNGAPVAGFGTVVAQEIGHCIGFRHSDYNDRSYSCGGSADNEGASDVGAVNIPGTPDGVNGGSGSIAASWMLACGSASLDRPFTATDKVALNYLY